MKTLAYTILLSLSFCILKAQSISTLNELAAGKYDSIHQSLEYRTYTILKSDTLEYRDVRVYRFIKTLRFRQDTTIKTQNGSYPYTAEEPNTIYTFPIFEAKQKKLWRPILDTIYDSSDPSKYRVKRIDSIQINFAEAGGLYPNSFFKTVKKIERLAEEQGIIIETIHPSFYGDKKSPSAMETIEEEDFENVEFATVTFLFRKGEFMVTYPLLFEK